MGTRSRGTPWGEIRSWACGSRRGVPVADSVQHSARFPLSAVSSRHLKVSEPRVQRTGRGLEDPERPRRLAGWGGNGGACRHDKSCRYLKLPPEQDKGDKTASQTARTMQRPDGPRRANQGTQPRQKRGGPSLPTRYPSGSQYSIPRRQASRIR